MLILKRRRGEELVINRNIVIRVLRVRGGQVSLGIQAPKETPVHRLEVHERIERESQLESMG